MSTLKFFDVLGGYAKPPRAILELAQARVAGNAQKAPEYPGFVVVVTLRGLHLLSADFAQPILSGKGSLILPRLQSSVAVLCPEATTLTTGAFVPVSVGGTGTKLSQGLFLPTIAALFHAPSLAQKSAPD